MSPDPDSVVRRIERSRNDVMSELTTLEATVRAKRKLLEEAERETNRRRAELEADEATLQDVRGRVARLSKGLSAAKLVEETLELVDSPSPAQASPSKRPRPTTDDHPSGHPRDSYPAKKGRPGQPNQDYQSSSPFRQGDRNFRDGQRPFHPGRDDSNHRNGDSRYRSRPDGVPIVRATGGAQLQTRDEGWAKKGKKIKFDEVEEAKPMDAQVKTEE